MRSEVDYQSERRHLSPWALNEVRDLRATSDLRSLFRHVLGAHLGVSERALDT
ncbi:hypothetical protein M3S04_02380 [Xanthomonas sp. PPL139]|uniref:hypothetical protein n=1 Tax=unclassified Xanthomonas TaxID=2643310 RepID=UPI00339FC3AE